MYERDDPRDPLFKGCTRPAMVFGVPLVPLACVTGVVVLLSIWINLLIVFVLVPTVVIMRLIAQKDDQQYRLLGLKIMFQLGYFFQNGRFWKASAYSPVAFQKRK